MAIPGNLFTTAMAVMPHKDVDQALATALMLDIPFWPQLPNFSYYEDMYVQASEHFPGIHLDLKKKQLKFLMNKFLSEFEATLAHINELDFLDISSIYSVVYHKFLTIDFSCRPAIHGQLEGPISFGYNVKDQDGRPLIFNNDVWPFLLEFMGRRVNTQLKRLQTLNPNAFMFVDEPGLQFVFSGMSGYGDIAARRDMEFFFSLIERPRGIHLCGNPDWDFLLNLDLDVLSLDAYHNGERFVSYASSIKKFLNRGGVIIWGIVPTQAELFSTTGLTELAMRLKTLWLELEKVGIDRYFLLSHSLLSPATCCLINSDGAKTVDMAFMVVQALSQLLREELKLAT